MSSSSAAYADRAEATLSDVGFRPRYSSIPASSASSLENEWQSFEVDLGRARVVISSTRTEFPEWLRSSVEGLNRIASLEPNWDSYGARMINQRTLEYALEVIIKLMEETTIQPKLYPTPPGGITLEWRKDDRQLHVEVEKPLRLLGYYYDRLTGEEWEPERPVDRQDIAGYLRKIDAA